MKLQKKHLIAGVIGVASVSAALLYWQYQKLMDYCISFNKLVFKKFSLQQANFDIYLNFKNNSSLKLDIVSQDYKVYINDKEVVRASNASAQTIQPNGSSLLSVAVEFQPEKVVSLIGSLASDIALAPNKVIVTVKVNVKVKLWFLTVNIPYEYKTSLKDLLANKQENKSTTNTKKC